MQAYALPRQVHVPGFTYPQAYFYLANAEPVVRVREPGGLWTKISPTCAVPLFLEQDPKNRCQVLCRSLSNIPIVSAFLSEYFKRGSGGRRRA